MGEKTNTFEKLAEIPGWEVIKNSQGTIIAIVPPCPLGVGSTETPATAGSKNRVIPLIFLRG